MSRNDLDNGRLKAEIGVLPAAAISRITVILDLAAPSNTEARMPEVA
jgi:hypothetical protein